MALHNIKKHLIQTRYILDNYSILQAVDCETTS